MTRWTTRSVSCTAGKFAACDFVNWKAVHAFKSGSVVILGILEVPNFVKHLLTFWVIIYDCGCLGHWSRNLLLSEVKRRDSELKRPGKGSNDCLRGITSENIGHLTMYFGTRPNNDEFANRYCHQRRRFLSDSSPTLSRRRLSRSLRIGESLPS